MTGLALPVLGTDQWTLGGDAGATPAPPKKQLRDKNGLLLYDKNHQRLYSKSNG